MERKEGGKDRERDGGRGGVEDTGVLYSTWRHRHQVHTVIIAGAKIC